MYFISAFYGILSWKGEMLYREKMGIIENLKKIITEMSRFKEKYS
jgi:hypothetical protein